MKRITLIFIALIALALPTAAVAHQGGKGESKGKRCGALVSKKGGKGRKAGKCAKKQLKRLARETAVEGCRDERAEDVRAFMQKYGSPVSSSEFGDDEAGEETGADADDPENEDEDESDEPGEDQGGDEGDDDGERKAGPKPRAARRALEKCVKVELKASKKAFKGAVKECRAERAEDVVAFRAKYGTNANKRNAFGKCVSGHVNGDDEADNDGEQGGKEPEEEDGGSDPGFGKNKED
jgi:hypothetical protein